MLTNLTPASRSTWTYTSKTGRRPRTIFFDGDAFAKRILEEGCDVVIVEADLVQKEVLEACDLKMIGACRGDPVNIDVEASTKKGIPVFYTPARNAEAVADLTLCFMLMIARNVYNAVSFVKGKREQLDNAGDYLKMYESMTGVELFGRTVGIVGFGAIGQRVAQRVRPFGSRIVAYDPFVPESVFEELGVEKAELDTVMSEADFLTIHAPDIPETKGMIGAREIGLLKDGVYFVNTGSRRHGRGRAALRGVRLRQDPGSCVRMCSGRNPFSRAIGLSSCRTSSRRPTSAVRRTTW